MAMQAAGSTDSQVFKGSVMDVANAGEKIYPGELAKALKLISEGKDVDYVGASAVELIGSDDLLAAMLNLVKGGKFKQHAIAKIKSERPIIPIGLSFCPLSDIPTWP